MDNVYTQFSGNNPFASQAKMLFHGDRLASYLATGDCYPVFCEVNLTNLCNLRCRWCISENFKTNRDALEIGPLLRFAEEFQASGGSAVTFSGGGEPTLHPEFVACIERFRAIGLELGLMTNGTYDESLNVPIAANFQWLRISLDTLDPQHYEAWKGTDWTQRVLANIAALSSNGSAIRVGINCNVHKNLTIAEVDALINLLDEYAISYLQFRPIIPRYFKDEPLALNTRVWSYLLTVNDPRINYSYDKYNDLISGKSFPFRVCEAHRLSFVLNSNGDVCTCMYHPGDQRFVFGNIYHNSLAEIWHSQRRRDVIVFLRTRLEMAKECQVCCKLCELNKLFDFLRTTGLDTNFL